MISPIDSPRAPWLHPPVVIAWAIRKLVKKGSAQGRVTPSLAAADPPSRNPMYVSTLSKSGREAVARRFGSVGPSTRSAIYGFDFPTCGEGDEPLTAGVLIARTAGIPIYGFLGDIERHSFLWWDSPPLVSTGGEAVPRTGA